MYGVAAMIITHLAFGKERFKAWKLLQGLVMDNYYGNFKTVNILRKLEEVEEFSRSIFSVKSNILSKYEVWPVEMYYP